MKFDMTTFGETMIRISVRPGQTLENTTRTDFYTGGTESNTAVALARLGMKTAWVSRLTDNPLGRRVEADVSRHGVDTSGIIWTEKDRVGTYYVEFATPPRATAAFYDRKNSAISRIKPGDIDWKFLLNTRIIHLTGITPALSASCHRAVAEAIKRARAKRIPISFDVNYRAKLWKPQAAAKVIGPMLKDCTLAIMTRDDAANVFRLTGEPENVVKEIRARFGPKIAVLTMAGEGGLVWDGRKMLFEQGYTLRGVIDRLGAGDAFSAGMIYGYLKNDLMLGLKFGIATSAMKLGMRGDNFWSSLAEVEEVIRSRGGDVRR